MASNAIIEAIGKYNAGEETVHVFKHTPIAAESYSYGGFIDENSEIVDGKRWSFFACRRSINNRFEAIVL